MTLSPILGIDVSFWQDDNNTPQRINWTQAKSAGAAFAFIRAGQNTWHDEDFAYNWHESKRAGIPRGAYWYLDNRTSAQAQAQRFYDLVAGTGSTGELPLVVDFEMRAGAPSPATAQSRLKSALLMLENLDRRTPMIYTGPAYWREYGSPAAEWHRYPLWIAHYGVTLPTVPAPWTGYTFWQYTTTGDGKAYGMESRGLDMNQYQRGSGFDHLFGRLTDAQKLDILWEDYLKRRP